MSTFLNRNPSTVLKRSKILKYGSNRTGRLLLKCPWITIMQAVNGPRSFRLNKIIWRPSIFHTTAFLRATTWDSAANWCCKTTRAIRIEEFQCLWNLLSNKSALIKSSFLHSAEQIVTVRTSFHNKILYVWWIICNFSYFSSVSQAMRKDATMFEWYSD